MHELEDIGLCILSSRDLDVVRNISEALLESGGIACVDPENPYLRRAVSNSISVFDSELRLALR